MGAIILSVIALAALAGLTLGVRHIYLHASRPRGFDCSLRIADGDVTGLTHRFRAGLRGPRDGRLRLAAPGLAVRRRSGSRRRRVRLDEERAPGLRDHLISVPASFAVVPVTLADGSRIDLALPRRRRDRVVAALGPTTAS